MNDSSIVALASAETALSGDVTKALRRVWIAASWLLAMKRLAHE